MCVCAFIVLKEDILQEIIEMIRLKKNEYFIKNIFYYIYSVYLF